MQIPHDAILLRIFIGESDRWQHQPLYEAIVLKAREMHLAGATVVRGQMGFGKSSRLHTSKIIRLSQDLPLVIEIVDSEEKINSFLPTLDGMVGGGLVTLEKVKVLHYGSGDDSPENKKKTMNDLKSQISVLMNGQSDRDTVLKKALEHVLADFQSETGTIHLLDADSQLLQLTAQMGLPPQMLDVVKTIPVGKGIAGQTVAQNKPVSICNLQTDTSGVAKPGARQTGVGGALCVPIRKDGKIIGTLGIGTRRQHEYTPEETQRLEDVANLISAYLTT